MFYISRERCISEHDYIIKKSHLLYPTYVSPISSGTGEFSYTLYIYMFIVEIHLRNGERNACEFTCH